MAKTTRKDKKLNKKRTIKRPIASNNEKIIWTFEDVDKDGKFAFNVNREDFNHKEIVDKLLSFSTMTWDEVIKATHDKAGKSKHHYIDVEKFSKEARERFHFKCKEEDSEAVFSFALQNKLRVIGVRQNEFFRVLWYDPNHEFYPTSKK